MENGQAGKRFFRTRVLDGFLWCCGPFVWLGAWVRLFLRALWVARVSIASLIVAAVVLSLVPQAQDLFIELKWRPEGHVVPWAVVHWAWFFFLTFCLWVVPVYFGARLALQINQDRIGVDTLRKYQLIVVYLPRLLGVLCFIVITAGIYGAYRNLPRGTPGADEPILAEARQHLGWLLASSIALNVALCILFYFLPTLPVLKRLHQLLTPIYWLLRGLLNWLQQPSTRFIHRSPPAPPPSSPVVDPQELNVQRNILVSIAFFLAVIFIINTLIVVISPGMAGNILPRANLVPIMLGAMVPFLTFLAILSHRLRHPSILYFIALLVAITSLTPTWHDVKCVPDKSDSKRCAQIPERRQMTLKEAVDAWKAVNCINGGCPQPIIVAGEGGASRAAFVLASTLAGLEEESSKKDWVGGKFSDRLFALSTVSGSGLGAAVFLGAIEAHEESKVRTKPWANSLTKPWMCNWFGCHHAVEPKLSGDFGPLKRAVQQVIAGDFLTSVLMALGFHDVWRFESLGMKSRAAVLENAWQERYSQIFENDFLERPLSRVAPPVDPQDKPKWRPILIFNGTLVQSGRRVITSSLAAPEVFRHSWDFYGLMCQSHDHQDVTTDCPCKETGQGIRVPSCDVSVTTAILNTARFPVVSPPGNIKSPPGNVEKGKASLVHLVVDGGYFESSGSLTAMELATALDGYGIPPLILQVTNDPESFLEECGKTAFTADPDVRRPFGFLLDPIDTVLNSRVARGYHATATARNTRAIGSYAAIRICPEEEADEPTPITADKKKATDPGGKYKQLSYSWWLSMPVQQYLHKQLDEGWNKRQMEIVLNSLRQPARPRPEPAAR